MPHRKLAIIGYGKIAQDQHIPAIAGSHAFDLVAVTSRHAKAVPGVDKVFPDPAQMYAQVPELACVAVCSAPTKRFDTARQALLAGKSVLLEKPPAATLGEARALIDLAKARGLTLFATWHARANPAVSEATRRLAGQPIQSMVITWKEDVRKWHPGQEWVWTAGGFGVFDPGVNALSIATAILPGTLFVQSAKLSTPSNRQQPIAVDLVFQSEPPADSLTAAFDWRQIGPQTLGHRGEDPRRLHPAAVRRRRQAEGGRGLGRHAAVKGVPRPLRPLRPTAGQRLKRGGSAAVRAGGRRLPLR